MCVRNALLTLSRAHIPGLFGPILLVAANIVVISFAILISRNCEYCWDTTYRFGGCLRQRLGRPDSKSKKQLTRTFKVCYLCNTVARSKGDDPKHMIKVDDLEKFVGGPTPPYHTVPVVSINKVYVLILNKVAYTKLGKPDSVYLHFSRSNSMIVVEPAPSERMPGGPIRKPMLIFPYARTLTAIGQALYLPPGCAPGCFLFLNMVSPCAFGRLMINAAAVLA